MAIGDRQWRVCVRRRQVSRSLTLIALQELTVVKPLKISCIPFPPVAWNYPFNMVWNSLQWTNLLYPIPSSGLELPVQHGALQILHPARGRQLRRAEAEFEDAAQYRRFSEHIDESGTAPRYV